MRQSLWLVLFCSVAAAINLQSTCGAVDQRRVQCVAPHRDLWISRAMTVLYAFRQGDNWSWTTSIVVHVTRSTAYQWQRCLCERCQTRRTTVGLVRGQRCDTRDNKTEMVAL